MGLCGIWLFLVIGFQINGPGSLGTALEELPTTAANEHARSLIEFSKMNQISFFNLDSALIILLGIKGFIDLRMLKKLETTQAHQNV